MMFKVHDHEAGLSWNYLWDVDNGTVDIQWRRDGQAIIILYSTADDSKSVIIANTSEEFWEWLPDQA